MSKKVQDFIKTLNSEQINAVYQAQTGINLVTAGPGSGKTRTIIGCVANLLDHAIDPEKICVVTFTNKAAKELNDRLSSIFDKDVVKKLQVGTFHAISLQILKKYGKELGLKSFSTLSDYDIKKSLKAVMAQAGIDSTDKVKVADYKAKISGFKNSLITPKIAIAVAGTEEEKAIAEVYREYQRYNWKRKTIDFDDMIWYAYTLLVKSKAARTKLGIEHLIVDECQDSNIAQIKLSNVICSTNLSYFGDLDQSIYGWRGATPDAFSPSKFSGTISHLETNYRSTKTIVAASQAVIRNNIERIDMDLKTDNEDGSPITHIIADQESMQNFMVAKRIKELLVAGEDPSEIAVFYRTNNQSRLLEHALKDAYIPYKIIGGFSFFERKEIKDITAMLNLLNNSRDDASLERVLSNIRGFGLTSINKMRDEALVTGEPMLKIFSNAKLNKRQANKRAQMILSFKNAQKVSTLSDKLKLLLEVDEFYDQLKSGTSPEILSRLENVKEFIAMVKEVETENPSMTLQDFVDMISLESVTDKSQDSDKINLMTLHSSKGLEFKHVFMIGCVDGLLPHRNSLSQPELVEEERRLFYVGMTRAKENLNIFSYAQSKFGEKFVYSRQSRFIDEIPRQYISIT